ncbi:hypothetical protein RJ641_013296 [Dillenia turbinata]|uniref:Glycosyltransferase N-terminal domain-containing protein n=1 Tax=Dillenia turbinata TaxID=194707 RepID=A0AAN8ZQC6_9MAGN
MEESMRLKPHVVCIPLPLQGHINPMFKLAKLLHYRGFHVTFVHTEFNLQRLINSRGLDLDSLNRFNGFRFATVTDGLPPTNTRALNDLPALCINMPIHTLNSFRDLIIRLNSSPDIPPVTCIVSDGVMSFTLEVAEEFGILEVLFFTPSACGVLGYLQFEELIRRGYFPLKVKSILELKNK